MLCTVVFFFLFFFCFFFGGNKNSAVELELAGYNVTISVQTVRSRIWAISIYDKLNLLTNECKCTYTHTCTHIHTYAYTCILMYLGAH